MNRKMGFALLTGAVLLLSGAGALGAPIDNGYQGTRAQLRVYCARIMGDLMETQSKTRCQSASRGVLIICKDKGKCVTQPWAPSEM